VDRQTRRLFLAALGVLAVVAAVAAVAFAGRSDGKGRPSGPTADGVVVQVESSGLTAVAGFTLRTADGQELRFGLAELRNATSFPPAHLAEHVATATPVRVWYREAAAGLEALWLEDAPGPAGPS
jgi:hypothetical protein